MSRGPFFEAGITCSGNRTGRRYFRTARRAAPPPPTSGSQKARRGSVLCSYICRSHTRSGCAQGKRGSPRLPVETQSRDAEGDGEADVIKEATVPRVASLPTPMMAASPGPVKDVTVGDETAMNGTPATVVLDPLSPPASEDDGCTSVDTATTKQSSSTGGRFREQSDMEGAYVESVGEVKRRHGLGTDWQDTCASRVMGVLVRVDPFSLFSLASILVTCTRIMPFSTRRSMVTF
jgi:hypothetical protein